MGCRWKENHPRFHYPTPTHQWKIIVYESQCCYKQISKQHWPAPSGVIWPPSLRDWIAGKGGRCECYPCKSSREETQTSRPDVDHGGWLIPHSMWSTPAKPAYSISRWRVTPSKTVRRSLRLNNARWRFIACELRATFKVHAGTPIAKSIHKEKR